MPPSLSMRRQSPRKLKRPRSRSDDTAPGASAPGAPMLAFIDESRGGEKMTIAKVEVERFSLISSKPFDAVVAALKSAVGQPDIVEFFKATRAAISLPDLERIVQRGLGRTGLMLFAEFDLGAILCRETG